MATPDMPNVPPQYTPVIIAQASPAQEAPAKIDRTIGICKTLSNPPSGGPTAGNTLTPAQDVASYFYAAEKRTVAGASTITVLEQPKHGKLEDVGTMAFDEMKHAVRDTGVRSYNYIPESGYLGGDKATLLVDIGGYKVKAEYAFQISAKFDEKLCPTSYWKISSVSNIYDTVAAVNFRSPDVSATLASEAPKAR